MPTELDCKTEVDLALQRAKEKLAEHEKTLKWHECFQTALNGLFIGKNQTEIHIVKNSKGIICCKKGEKFTVRMDLHYTNYFFVWEKWFVFSWKRTRFTFQETLNLLAEINVAGKTITFEIET